MFSSCSSLFYYPTRQLHFPPEKYGLHPEEVQFQSADGTHLFGWLFHHDERNFSAKAKAVFLFFHGNGENLSSHYLSLTWALAHGFDFFIFDYRGYGRSEGSPTPEGTVADGAAALRWLHGRYRETPLVIFGQSLGGAVALRNAIDLKAEIPFQAVIVDSAFASYRQVAKKIMAKGLLTWPFQWIPLLLLSDRFAPEGRVAEIAPVPILILHAEKDETVPFGCGEDIFQQAGEPREIWKIPGGGHTDSFFRHGNTYREKLLSWLSRVLH